jgi:hypothetical protein
VLATAMFPLWRLLCSAPPPNPHRVSPVTESCLDRWRRELLKEVYVTASLSVVGALALLLVPRGFQYRAIERERYGAGRDEVVLAWTPAGREASADHGWVNEQLSCIRSLHTD